MPIHLEEQETAMLTDVRLYDRKTELNMTQYSTRTRKHSRINGVIFLNAVKRVRLGSLDDFLCVVQQKHAKQDQTSINRHRVQAGSESGGGGQKHGACGEERADITSWEVSD